MTPEAVGGWGVGYLPWSITNHVLKFRKVIKFENSLIVICFSYIYLIIDGKRFTKRLTKNLPIKKVVESLRN